MLYSQNIIVLEFFRHTNKRSKDIQDFRLPGCSNHWLPADYSTRQQLAESPLQKTATKVSLTVRISIITLSMATVRHFADILTWKLKLI